MERIKCNSCKLTKDKVSFYDAAKQHFYKTCNSCRDSKKNKRLSVIPPEVPLIEPDFSETLTDLQPDNNNDSPLSFLSFKSYDDIEPISIQNDESSHAEYSP